jgi:hypothetical protein
MPKPKQGRKPTQTNQKGYEIPVPKKRDVLADLTTAAFTPLEVVKARIERTKAERAAKRAKKTQRL